MRYDMAKVIVERPRHPGYHPRKRKGRYYENISNSIRNSVQAYFIDPDEAESPPSMESMRPKGRGVDRKELNENLSPLWSFLQSRVGQPWNNVYSEIREYLGPNSAIQMHVVQHVKQAVETDTLIVNGVIGYIGKYGRGFTQLETTDRFRHRQFYVHPITKILCVPVVKKPVKTKGISKITIDKYHQFRLINDVWYWIKLEKIPEALGIISAYYYQGFRLFDFKSVGDIIFPDGLSNWQRKNAYGEENLRAVEKRQCGRRELKQIKKILSK